MLTDIFAERYSGTVVRSVYSEVDRRLFVQCFCILNEQVCPYYVNGKISERGKKFWSDINSLLSMELGLQSLSSSYYSFQIMWNGKPTTQSGIWDAVKVCENWMLKEYDSSVPPDRFIKERVSLVEVALRRRESELYSKKDEREKDSNFVGVLARLTAEPMENSVSSLDRSKILRDTRERFQAAVDEINIRFRQAQYNLNYHNGFIQISADLLANLQIEKPFWSTVSDPKWKNVDTDIKEAVDRRDNGARDPAFYAARALESTIKIISDEKGWTHGREKGAHNYIDNLAARRNALISDWEATILKEFFSKVRNPPWAWPGQRRNAEPHIFADRLGDRNMHVLDQKSHQTDIRISKRDLCIVCREGR
jgi:hypothetical protein